MTEAKEITKEIFNQLNGNSREFIKTFLEALNTEHNTLQQLFWKYVKELAKGYKPNYVDGRNELAVEFAQLVAGLKTYLPLI